MMEMAADNNGKNVWRCNVCAKVIKFQTHIERHIETHIEGVSFTCQLCGAIKKSSRALNIHLIKYHE